MAAEDPRKARTKSALQAAVLTLFRVKPIAEISVADVVAQAGVNRSSFYVHYPSLHALYADALEAVAVDTARNSRHSEGADAERPEGEAPAGVREYIHHIAEHADTYRWALGPEGCSEIGFRLRERFRESLLQGFSHHVPDGTTSFDLQAAFLAGGMVGAITQWLCGSGDLDPDAFSDWLWSETRLAFAAAIARVAGVALV